LKAAAILKGEPYGETTEAAAAKIQSARFVKS
jgi:hypothetical protein